MATKKKIAPAKKPPRAAAKKAAPKKAAPKKVAAPKKATAKKDAPKAKAASFAADGALHVLVARGATCSTIELRVEGGKVKVIGERPAVSRAHRVAALAGEVLTVNRDGKAKLVRADGSARAANLGGGVDDVVVCHGVAWACGSNRNLARLDADAATWSGAGLRQALEPLLPVVHLGTDDVESITSGARGPIVAVHANSYRRVLVMEHDGAAWRRRCDLPHRSNALAWSPKDDVVYSVGDEVFAIDAHGKVKKLGDDDDEGLWAAAWARGALWAATLASVSRVDVKRGALEEVLPWGGGGEVPHNHSLFTDGARLAFVRAGKLWLSTDARFVEVPLA